MSLTLALLITSVAEEKPSLEDWWAFAKALTAIAGLVLLPLAVLSVLNRFFVGEILCVLNEKGLYYEEKEAVRLIPWRELRRVSYQPDIPWRSGYRSHCYCNRAEITVQSFKKKKPVTHPTDTFKTETPDQNETPKRRPKPLRSGNLKLY